MQARHAETRTTRSAPLLADGSFAIEQIPPGRVTVSAGNAAGLLAQSELELQSGQVLSGVRLTAVPAQPAEAQVPAIAETAPSTEVRPAHGAPVDNARVAQQERNE